MLSTVVSLAESLLTVNMQQNKNMKIGYIGANFVTMSLLCLLGKRDSKDLFLKSVWDKSILFNAKSRPI